MVLTIWLSVSHTIGDSVSSHISTFEVQPPSYIDNNNIYEVKHTTPNKDIPHMNTEPVIFEPIRNIKLSRATYKVTSYINFDPYLNNFMKFGKYLTAFKKDLKDEKKMVTLMEIIPQIPIGRT